MLQCRKCAINLDVAMWAKCGQKEYEYRFQWHGIFRRLFVGCLMEDIRGVSRKQEVSWFSFFPRNWSDCCKSVFFWSILENWLRLLNWLSEAFKLGIGTYQRYHACRTFTQFYFKKLQTTTPPIQNKGLFTDFFTLKQHHVNHDFFGAIPKTLSGEQWKTPSLFKVYRAYRGWNPTGLSGDYFLSHEILGFLLNNQDFSWKDIPQWFFVAKSVMTFTLASFFLDDQARKRANQLANETQGEAGLVGPNQPGGFLELCWLVMKMMKVMKNPIFRPWFLVTLKNCGYNLWEQKFPAKNCGNK